MPGPPDLNPRQANFINAAWNLGGFDLGACASNRVGLTMVGSGGRFIN